MEQTLLQKIVLLNQTTLGSMVEKDNKAIIKNFTETGIKILEADFGFAWWKFHDNEEYQLAYKSPATPYEPTIPREKAGNYIARTTKKPFFDSQVKKENYEFNISRYLKSYIIVPIYYGEFTYGSLVFCYKKEHFFTEDEKDIALVLGTTTAQAINIHRLVEAEQRELKKFELMKVNQRLLKEERLKVESIADATHELRTPLAIIKGNIDLALLNAGEKEKNSKGVFKAINHEIRHLSNIISDLALITSKGKELRNMVSYTEVDIKSLIKDSIERCKVLAHDKKISITSKNIPSISILGDKIYLEKMLTNLIKNSITYGNKNGHTLISTEESKRFITVIVSDDGMGISKEDLPHVFERFYRADKSHNSEGKNTGLGLAIVKWVAEIHNGFVSVKNNKKKGSTFSVTLPKNK